MLDVFFGWLFRETTRGIFDDGTRRTSENYCTTKSVQYTIIKFYTIRKYFFETHTPPKKALHTTISSQPHQPWSQPNQQLTNFPPATDRRQRIRSYWPSEGAAVIPSLLAARRRRYNGRWAGVWNDPHHRHLCISSIQILHWSPSHLKMHRSSQIQTTIYHSSVILTYSTTPTHQTGKRTQLTKERRGWNYRDRIW